MTPQCGADARIRTADLRITNALLYQLSYIGVGRRAIICKRRCALNLLSAGLRRFLPNPIPCGLL